jgi:hypothetical protein
MRVRGTPAAAAMMRRQARQAGERDRLRSNKRREGGKRGEGGEGGEGGEERRRGRQGREGGEGGEGGGQAKL